MRIIDLSMELKSGMDVYESDPPVTINVVHDYHTHNWQLRHLSMGSHTGTHVDAFSHMHQGKANLDQIPLKRFFGPAQCVSLNQTFPKGLGLFFIEAVSIKHLDRILESNPGFVGGNVSESLERALLKNNIITYTNLINLELLPKNQTFMFYGLPLKIQAGDGSPVRAIAIID